VSLQRNGEVVAAGYSNVVDATSGRLTFSVDATLKLNVGDAITIFIYDGPSFLLLGVTPISQDHYWKKISSFPKCVRPFIVSINTVVGYLYAI